MTRKEYDNLKEKYTYLVTKDIYFHFPFLMECEMKKLLKFLREENIVFEKTKDVKKWLKQ